MVNKRSWIQAVVLLFFWKKALNSSKVFSYQVILRLFYGGDLGLPVRLLYLPSGNIKIGGFFISIELLTHFFYYRLKKQKRRLWRHLVRTACLLHMIILWRELGIFRRPLNLHHKLLSLSWSLWVKFTRLVPFLANFGVPRALSLRKGMNGDTKLILYFNT